MNYWFWTIKTKQNLIDGRANTKERQHRCIETVILKAEDGESIQELQ